MRVVIAGCGRVGSTLARRLAGEGHEVTVVDVNEASFDRLGPDFGGNMVPGNALDEELLRVAGIETADAFCSVTNGDNRNIMMAQVAKNIFHVPRVITRIYDPIREEVYRSFGLETFCSTTIGSGIIHDFFVDGFNKAHPEAAGAR